MLKLDVKDTTYKEVMAFLTKVIEDYEKMLLAKALDEEKR
jgi:hypothetical protein